MSYREDYFFDPFLWLKIDVWMNEWILIKEKPFGFGCYILLQLKFIKRIQLTENNSKTDLMLSWNFSQSIVWSALSIEMWKTPHVAMVISTVLMMLSMIHSISAKHCLCTVHSCSSCQCLISSLDLLLLIFALFFLILDYCVTSSWIIVFPNLILLTCWTDLRPGLFMTMFITYCLGYLCLCVNIADIMRMHSASTMVPDTTDNSDTQ